MAPKAHRNPLGKMVQRPPGAGSLRRGRGRRLFQAPPDEPTFPIAAVEIDWDRVITQRETVLTTVGEMPTYLLKPEVLGLLAAEKHPTYRLILDLMCSTGARISEVLALTPASFINNGYDFGVVLESRKQGAGRRGQGGQPHAAKRYVPITDDLLADRIQSYLYAGRFSKHERLFTMARQTVNRHIDATVARVGGAPFSIHAHTFRHSFAIHLLLHGRPLKYVSQLLGHRSIESTEIYLNVLTVDGGHLLEGVDFH